MPHYHLPLDPPPTYTGAEMPPPADMATRIAGNGDGEQNISLAVDHLFHGLHRHPPPTVLPTAQRRAAAMDRQDLVRNAVLFLNDPKVHSSPLTQRIEFLQGKGLTEPEIQQALQEAANPSAALSTPAAAPAYARPPPANTTSSPYGYGQAIVVPPEPPKRDWRDIFIMAVVSGGVMYGLTALARKYLTPHLQPPSSTAFQETSASLSEQYDAAQAALDELREQTTALTSAAEAERERVSAALDDVEAAAKTVRDAEARWRDDMREVRGEVESVRELVPRLIEKHSAAQSAALTDLQSELRSLKTLLVARQGAAEPAHAPAPAAVPAPAKDAGGVSGYAVPGGSAGAVPAAPASGTASPTPSTPTIPSQTGSSLLQPRTGKASIPAWQLPNGGSTAGSASGSSSLASSPPKE